MVAGGHWRKPPPCVIPKTNKVVATRESIDYVRTRQTCLSLSITGSEVNVCCTMDIVMNTLH